MNALNARYLPLDDNQRRQLHNEVHARPSARVRLPAWIVYMAVLNAGVAREQEWAHLKKLSGHADQALFDALVSLAARIERATAEHGYRFSATSPAMATVQAAEKRLASLAERVSRTSALLRTRVDIATEAQNQVPLVFWGVWKAVQRIHEKLHQAEH